MMTMWGLVLIGLVLMAAACSTPANRESAPSSGARLTLSLPDVSRVSESVRQQLTGRYASLTMKMQAPGIAAVELGQAYGEMGKALMAAEYLDAAEPSLLNAQSLMPDDMRWSYYLAHLYRLRNDRAKSAAFFEKTLQLRPGDVPTLIWLGGLHVDEGRADRGEPLLRKALSLQPGSAAALFRLGRAALARKDYGAAVKYLEDTLKADPRASIAHYPLALAYRGLGDIKRADAHIGERGAIDVALPDPLMQEVSGSLESALSYETQGVKALDKGEWSAAADYFRKGLALAPDNPSVRHRLGTSLFMMGDAQGALEQFEDTIRRSPDFAKAHYSLGVLMATSNRPQRAIDEFSAAVRYDANYVEARLRLAELLRRGNRIQESLVQYEQVLNVDPAHAEARLGHAVALADAGRYQEARDRLSEGMRAHPNQPVFAHALARLLAAAPDEGVRDGRRALAIVTELRTRGETAALAESTAMALAASGQYEQAAALQRQLLAAASRAGRAEVTSRLAADLAAYQRRQPSRTPWRADEPIATMLALK